MSLMPEMKVAQGGWKKERERERLNVMKVDVARNEWMVYRREEEEEREIEEAYCTVFFIWFICYIHRNQWKKVKVTKLG